MLNWSKMITVNQNCDQCGKKSFTWQSQPFMLGRYPAGNVLLSFGILTAGALISKILLLFKHMGLAAYKARTYFLHQREFLFPSVLHHWANYKTLLTEEMKCKKEVTICGDARFDSMGHSAKYGTFTIFCTNLKKIVDFELVQANYYD